MNQHVDKLMEKKIIRVNLLIKQLMLRPKQLFKPFLYFKR